MKRNTLAAIAALLILILVSCSATLVTSTLATVISVAQATFPLLAAEIHLPAATVTLVNGWLSALQSFLVQVTTIDSSSASPAVKVAQVAAAAASTATPGLPAGTPATVAAIVDTVAIAMQVFLKDYQGELVPQTISANSRALTSPPRAVDRQITFTLTHSTYTNLPASIKAQFVKP